MLAAPQSWSALRTFRLGKSSHDQRALMRSDAHRNGRQNDQTVSLVDSMTRCQLWRDGIADAISEMHRGDSTALKNWPQTRAKHLFWNGSSAS